jgi:hypothetical protein
MIHKIFNRDNFKSLLNKRFDSDNFKTILSQLRARDNDDVIDFSTRTKQSTFEHYDHWIEKLASVDYKAHIEVSNGLDIRELYLFDKKGRLLAIYDSFPNSKLTKISDPDNYIASMKGLKKFNI